MLADLPNHHLQWRPKNASPWIYLQSKRLKSILLSCRKECDQLDMDYDDEDVRELNRIIDKLTDMKVC